MAARNFYLERILISLGAVALVSCGGGSSGGSTGGGGGGGGISGIGGTGGVLASSVSVGPITGFGSIFVNGVEYETTSATINLDGNDALENQLKLGMVVQVNGTISDDGRTGIASRVIFDDDVQGPISEITTSTDGSSKTLVILGISVQVNALSTVFEDTTFNTLAVDDLVEVSGFVQEDGSIQSTRIERKSEFSAGLSEVEIKGTVENLIDNVFETRGYTVDFSSAQLSDFEGNTLANGLYVEVKGTLDGTSISATEIELEDEDSWDEVERGSIEGSITNFVSASEFNINGLPVNAGSASISPASLILQNGVQVEVEGNVSNGVLVATRVEARDDEVEIAGVISSLDAANELIEIGFGYQSVGFSVDSRTRFEDDLDDVSPFSLNNLMTGQFIEAHLINSDSGLLATEVKLDELDDFKLQASVEEFVANVSITLLGVTFSTTDAEFQNSQEQSISSQEFYDELEIGQILELKDETGDANVEEVEYED